MGHLQASRMVLTSSLPDVIFLFEGLGCAGDL